MVYCYILDTWLSIASQDYLLQVKIFKTIILFVQRSIYRSSPPLVFLGKGVLKI